MAIDISSKPNVNLLDPDYSLGRFVDAIAGSSPGTPLNLLTHGDYVQFFQKIMDEAGLTFNDQFDNDVNGYQYVQALLTLAGHDPWITGATPVGTTNTAPVGLVTIAGGNVVINKYRIVGKTMHWHLKLRNYTTAGVFQTMYLTSPVAVSPPGWANAGLRYLAFINGSPTLIVETSSVTSSGQITCYLSGGGNFTIGTSNQSLDIVIIAEIS